MTEFYPIYYIYKSTNRVLRRYNCKPINKFFLEKEKLDQLAKVLKKYLDLDKDDVVIKEYTGVVDDWR
jgi:hypothetical protein